MPNRRRLLQMSGAALLSSATRAESAQLGKEINRSDLPAEKPDYSIEIKTSVLELGKDIAISAKNYNGQFPGPLLRLVSGRRATIDIINTTDTPEQLHWHGLFLPADIDGAAEEGTPYIPPHSTRRVSLTPAPTGFRFYHTHLTAGTDLTLGLYNAQAGLVFIEPHDNAGAYDREIFLTLKEFMPFFNRMEMGTTFLGPKNPVRELFDIDQMSIKSARQAGRDPGYQIGYQYFTINGRMLGHGEPIRVKAGERILFHLLNASATEIRSLALPGHVFKIIAVDGNPVPTSAEVGGLWLAPGERISALVEMTTPGVWLMGDIDANNRDRGMGIVIEYAGSRGTPEWRQPTSFLWDYRTFARPGAVAQQPDETIEMLFETQYSTRGGFDTFTINGAEFSMQTMTPKFNLHYGRRYRLKMRNATDDVHPIHLHRHRFELTSVSGMPTAGVIKDVAMINSFSEMSVDFTADQRGMSLFHCHMQHHMDFGFMAIFDCM